MPSGIYERTEYHKKSIKEAALALGKNHPMRRPEAREKHRRIMKEVANRPEVKMKRAEWMKKHNPMKRPEVVAKVSGDNHSAKCLERRIRTSENQKRLWMNREYKENQVRAAMKANHIRPNKAESKLNSFLQRLLPHEYKYVGDGEFILAGKCPDFINTNGQKKIIELFGDYWHKGDDGKKRTKLFKKYGYQTLIVWEKELKNIPRLLEKLFQFNEA